VNDHDQGIDEANLPADEFNQNNAAGEEATNPNDAWTTVNEDQSENEVIEDLGDKINADENQDWNQYPTIDEIDQGRNLDNVILEAATASQINFVDEPILSESKINEDSNMNTLIQDETQIEDTKTHTVAAATEAASVQVPNHPEERKKTSPQKRMPSQRRFQSLDLNLNVDGASSISDTSSNSNYWHNFSFMKQKASFLYGNSLAMSRRTSDASSFVSGAQEIEDLYCDDEINPNLEDDPNMMLTTYYRNAVSANNDFNFPERPCLTDRDSVLSMDIPSTGPTSLRSEIGDDMGPIEEAEEAFLKN